MDQPPMNRAERRAAQGKGRRGRPPRSVRMAGVATPLVILPHPSPTLSDPQPPSIAGGDHFAADDVPDMEPDMAVMEDRAPADRSPREPRSAGSAAPRSHKALSKDQVIERGLTQGYGIAAFGIGLIDQYDGVVIGSQAETAARAWLATAKAEKDAGRPALYNVLLLLTQGGPYFALLSAHVVMVAGLMASHGQIPAQLVGFLGLPQPPVRAPKPAPETVPAADPLQTPAGAMATPLGAVTDDGLPPGMDQALHDMAAQTGRPYDELRTEALVQLAQVQLANGRSPVPAALGAIPQ